MIRSKWVCGGMALALLASAQAHAQNAAPPPAPSEVVSTAPVASDAPNTTAAQISDWINRAPPLGVADGDDGVITGARPNGLHGEVGAFVGNHGYGGFAAATMPVGKDATLGIAISDSHFNGRYFGDASSLSGDLAFGQARNRPIGCSADTEIDPRFDDPHWIRHVRGPALFDDPQACFGAVRTAR